MSMTELPRTFALSFGLALALAAAPVLAQETTTEAPATEATAADAPVADGLNMGTEAGEPAAPLTQETAEVGQTYTLAAFELWEQRCTKMADGSDPCQLYQLLKDKDGNNVAEISMFPLPAGGQAAAGATIIAPLETLLTANLLLAIDGTKPKIYPFTFCAQIGCIARVGFTAEEVNQFKKGAKATMTIIPAAAPDQKVDLDVSLKGFTAGYDAVATTLPK
ncbi:MAG: Invasion associated locus B family protein [Rhodobacteraceae bacterium]|uniref:invasion associated locus B family protein n=1 Tax=Cypionkella sp. TaxID=2811411 RepID=UPI0013273366|nr:MAG: Invasion associated locus B family protein [Paracoccaceae bacterium]